jgi:hypothetical protein
MPADEGQIGLDHEPAPAVASGRTASRTRRRLVSSASS